MGLFAFNRERELRALKAQEDEAATQTVESGKQEMTETSEEQPKPKGRKKSEQQE